MMPSLRLKIQKINIKLLQKYIQYIILRLILICLFNLDDLIITSSYNTILMNYTYKSSEYFQGNQNAT